MTRTKEELLAAWDRATVEAPLRFESHYETELFAAAMRERSRSGWSRPQTIIDREKVMGDGVKSMLDDRPYTSRHSYETHLRENNCRIVGNDTKPLRERLHDR